MLHITEQLELCSVLCESNYFQFASSHMLFYWVFFVSFLFCFVLVFFFLFNLYQVLVLIICLKIVYITVTDFFIFFNVQINLLNVNVLNLFRSLSDNRTYGADPRDVFYGVCMLNHDPTEINGSLPVHFHEVKTSPQFEEQYNPHGVMWHFSLRRN